MDIIVSARHSNLSQSMKEEAEARLERMAEIYPKLNRADVIMDTVKERSIVEYVLHGKGINMGAKAEAENLYAAVHEAADHLERQLEKHFGRMIKAHSGRHLGEVEAEAAEAEAAELEEAEVF